MGSCSKVVALLLDYIEGRLPADQQADLEGHLTLCPSCVASVRTYRSTVSLLHSIKEEDLPPELRMTLHSFLDHQTEN
jgi:anti-sigma factor RsiW